MMLGLLFLLALAALILPGEALLRWLAPGCRWGWCRPLVAFGIGQGVAMCGLWFLGMVGVPMWTWGIAIVLVVSMVALWGAWWRERAGKDGPGNFGWMRVLAAGTITADFCTVRSADILSADGLGTFCPPFISSEMLRRTECPPSNSVQHARALITLRYHGLCRRFLPCKNPPWEKMGFSIRSGAHKAPLQASLAGDKPCFRFQRYVRMAVAGLPWVLLILATWVFTHQAVEAALKFRIGSIPGMGNWAYKTQLLMMTERWPADFFKYEGHPQGRGHRDDDG